MPLLVQTELQIVLQKKMTKFRPWSGSRLLLVGT